METFNSIFCQELKGRDDEEKMFELLVLLGMSKPQEGTSILKKQNIVPEDTLRFYIEAAQRYLYFIQSEQSFTTYSQTYFKAFPKDRIMQTYSQINIQEVCEEATSNRVVLSHSRKETEILKERLTLLCNLLVVYAEKRPESYSIKQIRQSAIDFWEPKITASMEKI